MKGLDTSVRLAAGRTVRELMLIGAGAASIVAAVSMGDRSWNIYAYAATTLLFAIRFFAARVLYLSTCVGALALQLSIWARPGVTFEHQAPVLLQILALCLLLSGGDLLRRFDDHGRGLGPLRNFWRDLSVGQRRHLAWGMHLVGTVGGLLHHTIYNLERARLPVPAWLFVAIAACAAVGLLYLAGRAIAAPAAVVVGAVLAWQLRPQDVRAPELAWTPQYATTACVCAALTAAVALPWAWRWLRLAWRRDPG